MVQELLVQFATMHTTCLPASGDGLDSLSIPAGGSALSSDADAPASAHTSKASESAFVTVALSTTLRILS